MKSKTVIGVFVLLTTIILLLGIGVIVMLGRGQDKKQVTQTPTFHTPMPSPTTVPQAIITAIAPPTAAPEPTPMFRHTIKDILFPVALPARFAQYPWGYFATAVSNRIVENGAVISSTLYNTWHVISIHPAVQWCEDVVISAPDVSPHTAEVHPDMPIAVRRVHFVKGDNIRWGCQFPDGKIMWTSVVGARGEGCICDELCTVNLYSVGGKTLSLNAYNCFSVFAAKIVEWQNGQKTAEREIHLMGNWIVFGEFICSGGSHPKWEVCVDWYGNSVVPKFPAEEIREIR